MLLTITNEIVFYLIMVGTITITTVIDLRAFVSRVWENNLNCVTTRTSFFNIVVQIYLCDERNLRRDLQLKVRENSLTFAKAITKY